MRRASVGIVPRRGAAVADFGFRLVPRPEFHEAKHPQIQMIGADIRPQIAKLLFAGSPHFLEVVEDLLDRRAVGEGFQNLLDRGVWIGAEEEMTACRFLNDDDADHAIGGNIGGQKGLVLFERFFALLDALDGLPAVLLAGAFGQADAVLAVFARPSATAALTLLRHKRQVAESGVFPQTADHGHAPTSQRLQHRPLGVKAVGDDPQPFSRGFQVAGKAIQMAGFGRTCCGFLKVIGIHAKIRGITYDLNSYQ